MEVRGKPNHQQLLLRELKGVVGRAGLNLPKEIREM